jgi:hypothetical protein
LSYGNWKRHSSDNDYLDEEGDRADDASTEENVKADDMVLEWSIREWSRCSQTCGQNGTQVRN